MSSLSSSVAPNIPVRRRPIFEGLETDEEIVAAATREYERLKAVDDEGLDFANKTAQWIAYERALESARDDALFRDPLAKHLCEPYGQRLSDSMSFGLRVGCFDPPGANIGFGLEGHVMYTAARTKLINDYLAKWVNNGKPGKKQVVNVGAGLDTRPYWLPCLRDVESYWEIDTVSMIKDKQRRLESLKENVSVDLPTAPFCPIRSISMDFNNESVADLPTSYGFDSTIPSCWILEGLIMYLQRSDAEDLIHTISKLSASGSYIILNFLTNMPSTTLSSALSTSPTIDELDDCLKGWTKDGRLMFGEEGFHFNRYPVGKPASAFFGFAMYEKD